MTTASVCTIGDEILIGQIVDTNSSGIARFLNEAGVKVEEMSSIGDDTDAIISTLSAQLRKHQIVIVTGGLGPTKDDITKPALATLSGSTGMVENEEQKHIIHQILHSRGLDVLDVNLAQALVPDKCEVIPNRKGTAPIMVFPFEEGGRFGHKCVLYSLPGVPYEAMGALGDIISDIKRRFNMDSIIHKSLMTYGLAESALAQMIADWEDALPAEVHLAYLPNQITGVRLRLSVYGGDDPKAAEKLIDSCIGSLRPIIGDYLYAEKDSSLQEAIGQLLRGSGKTLSAAESCTGGMISHLLTTVPGSSEYYLGSVTSYAIPIKEAILKVSDETIRDKGIVSAAVACEMAEGARKLTGSTYSVATTGWADAYGDDREPAGTVWVAVSGPLGTRSARFNYRSGRVLNIERFAASALNELRKYIAEDLA